VSVAEKMSLLQALSKRQARVDPAAAPVCGHVRQALTPH